MSLSFRGRSTRAIWKNAILDIFFTIGSGVVRYKSFTRSWHDLCWGRPPGTNQPGAAPPVLTGSRRGGTNHRGDFTMPGGRRCAPAWSLHDPGRRAAARPGATARSSKRVRGRVVEDYEWGSLIFTNSRRGRVVEDSVRDFHDPWKTGASLIRNLQKGGLLKINLPLRSRIFKKGVRGVFEDRFRLHRK